MRSSHAAVMIQMSQQTRATLQGWLQRQKTPLGRAKRAQAMVLLEQGHSYAHTAKWVGLTERNLRKWAKRFHNRGVAGLDDSPRPGRAPVFPPEVALYIVKLACERPDDMSCSLSQWDCPELARKLKAE
jgi:transposase